MPSKVRSWGRALALVLLCLGLTFAAGCERRVTGLMLEVTIAEGHEVTLDGQVDELVFHIAVLRESERYVLDPAVNEHRDDVTGRSLASDPYLLLVKENGDGVMEEVRAAVLGYRGDQVVAWGWLEDPVSQQMIQGNIVYRTVALYDASTIPPEFFLTGLGCLVLNENGEIIAYAPNDMDCDDVPTDQDCDDEDPNVGPGMPEICGNGIDDNCNGLVDEIVDADGDGFTNCEPVDCDDENADVHPGATELCDGLDNDCDGACDVEFDGDGDGYTSCPDGINGSAAGPEGFCGQTPNPADHDCDDTRADMNPGMAEVCNGFDDNCNGLDDEGLSVACYEGPAGTQNVGQCRAGASHCIRGVQTPCTGQILPIPEACNGLDDDCDSQVDEAMPMLTCGLGVCQVTQSSCDSGQPQQCQPMASTQMEICGNGLDDDCNGLVDEGCSCIHVRPSGDNTSPGTPGQPMATINAAIARAAQAGQPKMVCVASEANCPAGNWTTYDEDVVMVDGVAVLGGFDPVNTSNWTRSPSCHTEIEGQAGPAVYFGPSVHSRTQLDGFVTSVDSNTGSAQSVVILIEGSTGAVVSNCQVFGALQGDNTVGIAVLDDVNGNPSTPQLLSNHVQGGNGLLLSVGIMSMGSAPFIQGSCDLANLDSLGRCTGGCWNGRHIRGNRDVNARPVDSYGVWLDDSPGAVVDQSAVCAGGGDWAAGLYITGDGAGIQFTRNNASAWGAAFYSDGVLMDDCAGASPWIANNDRVAGEGGPPGASVAIGVRALGDCHPLIEGNRLITGGGEASNSDCRGVMCGVSPGSGTASRCAVVGNETITGSDWGVPPSSYGVLCEPGACRLISSNQLIDGRGGLDTVGVYLVGTSNVVVDRNVIQSGCGAVWATGALLDNSTARIQNNVIGTSICSDFSSAGVDFVGMWVANGGGANEPDVHSNTIFGGGGITSCLSTGLALDLAVWSGNPTGPLGIYRNNHIHPGVCSSNYGVWERAHLADPRIFENNSVELVNGVTALYLDENSTTLSDEGQINGLLDMTVSGNIHAGCGFSVSPGQPVVIGATSPCRNAGTAAGVPGWDFFGELRPAESAPDIGPDEYNP